MRKPSQEDPSPSSCALLEATARLADAHSALTGLYSLLRQADDLHAITGANLAALLYGPLGEVAAAKDELRSAAAPMLRVVHS